jgi:adenylate cyclase class 2
MSAETEIKLRLPNTAHGRKLLRKHGFRLVHRRVFESNTLFDTPDARLRRGGFALRIRKSGRRQIVTYKGRAASGRHKSREELEFEVGNGDAAVSILERLGFQPVFRYDKYRTEFTKQRGLAMLDETPIGVFLELEGEPDWIDRTAAELGYDPEDYITASYAGLYRAWRQEHAAAPEHMIFQGFEGLRAR